MQVETKISCQSSKRWKENSEYLSFSDYLISQRLQVKQKEFCKSFIGDNGLIYTYLCIFTFSSQMFVQNQINMYCEQM